MEITLISAQQVVSREEKLVSFNPRLVGMGGVGSLAPSKIQIKLIVLTHDVSTEEKL